MWQQITFQRRPEGWPFRERTDIRVQRKWANHGGKKKKKKNHEPGIYNMKIKLAVKGGLRGVAQAKKGIGKNCPVT